MRAKETASPDSPGQPARGHTTPDLHPDVARLASLVQEAAELLLSCGETHWGSWLGRDGERIRRRDLRGLEHLLGAFGGMGSLNDLILHPLNGHRLAAEDADAANERLQSLLAPIHELASRQLREAQAADRQG